MIATMLIAVLFQLDAQPLCFDVDVRELCCPNACAVRARRLPSDADRVLRACMRELGCSDTSIRAATVLMNCDCFPERGA
jgi:hypothetical protein